MSQSSWCAIEPSSLTAWHVIEAIHAQLSKHAGKLVQPTEHFDLALLLQPVDATVPPCPSIEPWLETFEQLGCRQCTEDWNCGGRLLKIACIHIGYSLDKFDGVAADCKPPLACRSRRADTEAGGPTKHEFVAVERRSSLPLNSRGMHISTPARIILLYLLDLLDTG